MERILINTSFYIEPYLSVFQGGVPFPGMSLKWPIILSLTKHVFKHPQNTPNKDKNKNKTNKKKKKKKNKHTNRI